MIIGCFVCLFALQKLNKSMNKDKDQENISPTQKLEEVIRQKKTESDALKKLITSLENLEKKKTEKQ